MPKLIEIISEEDKKKLEEYRERVSGEVGVKLEDVLIEENDK